MTSETFWLSHPRLKRCVHTLAQGGVVAYPTEAVWGLGCDPFNRHGVEAILQMKQRPVHKGLIMVAASMDQIGFLLENLTQTQREQMQQSWPGPVTWLVPHHGLVPSWVSGNSEAVAVRVSAHPVVRSLCIAYGGPIISTSANPQGLAPARDVLRARRYFRKQPLSYSPGVVGRSERPSEIRDLISGRVLRN